MFLCGFLSFNFVIPRFGCNFARLLKLFVPMDNMASIFLCDYSVIMLR